MPWEGKQPRAAPARLCRQLEEKKTYERTGVGNPAPPAELSHDKLQSCIPVSPELYLGRILGK